MTRQQRIKAQRDKILVQFGIEVRRLRILKGFTQDELGYRCGLDRTFISDIENGWRNISLTTIYKLVETLEVDAEELLKPV